MNDDENVMTTKNILHTRIGNKNILSNLNGVICTNINAGKKNDHG